MSEPAETRREASSRPGEPSERPAPRDERSKLVEAARTALIRAALEGYEEAGLAGLCDEGRWEMAVDRMRALDLDALLKGPDDPTHQ